MFISLNIKYLLIVFVLYSIKHRLKSICKLLDSVFINIFLTDCVKWHQMSGQIHNIC